MLPFPEEFLPAEEATISLLPVVNGQGDRGDVLRYEGPMGANVRDRPEQL